MRKLYCLLGISLFISSSLNAQNWGFEAPATTPPNNISAVTGTWTVNTNATYVRTGAQSMTVTDPATSGTTIGTTSPFVTTTSPGYLIAIGWGKSNTASNASYYLGYRLGTANTLNPSSTSTPASTYWLNNTSWTRIISVSTSGTVAAGSYGWSLRAFRNASTTGTTLYIDDVILYASSSNVPDLTAPNAPTLAVANGNVLTWTNGTDNGAPASGIGGVVILRANGGSLTAPTLNDQAMYNPVNGAAGVGSFSDGTNTWTVVANIDNSTTTTFTDASGTGGPYTYAIYMRDMAYNYSPAITAGAATVCTDPPTPGTAISSVTSAVCANTSVILGLSGNSFGSGQTYQWQSSAALAGPYTSFGTAQASPSVTVNPASTTYYRAEVICSGGTPVYSTPVQVMVTQPLNGTFTINGSSATGGSNFQTFADAVNALNCGIGGPVIFNVAPGTYNEQVILPAIAGTSATNTITFNGGGATLTFLSTNANERATLKLNGTDWVTVNNLNIAAPATGTSDYGYGVQMLNDANNNTISNCTITVNQSATTSVAYAGILINSSAAPAAVTTAGTSLCDSNTITGNTIIGGSAGIAIVGNSSTSTVNNNSVTNNIIQDFYEHGIYLNGGLNTLIQGNNISRPTRSAVTNFRGVSLSGASNNTLISHNKIHNPFDGAAASTSAAYGVYFTACDAQAATPNVISNNLIYDFIGATGNHNALLIVSSDNTKMYYNTLVLNDVAATCSSCGTRGLYVQTAPVAGLEFKNNIVSITRGGTGAKQAIYLEGTGNIPLISNNNNLYVGSTGGSTNQIGYNNAIGYTSLLSWQGAMSQDVASVSIAPSFTSATDFTPTGNFDNLGMPVTGITTDITGATRNATNPDMGAYEFTGPVCSTLTAGSAVASSIVVCSGNPVVISLTGASIGWGSSYQWESASSLAGPWSNIGSASTTPAMIINPTSVLYYRAKVSCNSSVPVTSTEIQVTGSAGLSGNYTINAAQPTGGTNFESFEDAITGLACGVTGPVNFDVVAGSGPYNEQVVITPIAGTSATNRVTFNGNGNTLTFASTTSTTRTGITLSGADYITIKNLVIDGTAGTYAWGVLLTGQADNDSVVNCTINVSTSSTASDHCGILINGSVSTAGTSGNNANNTVITGNTVNGGYYGILAYAGTTAANTNTGNIITNNIVNDVYYYGIYLYYNTNAIVSGNDISRPNRTTTSTSVYNIYVSTGCVNTLVEKNRVHNLFDAMPGNTAATYGIYVSADGTSGQENKIYNNLIYKINSNGSIYGIYNTGAPYCNIYHNTISLDETSATAGLAYGFYQVTSATNIVFRNNIVTITRGGSGAKYAIYKSTAATPLVSNNNVLYVNSAGSGLQGVGYQGSQQATLAAWQGTSGQDANSTIAYPLYLNLAAGNFIPNAPSVDNIGAGLGVTTDIAGTTRNATTPDPGAYEFTVVPCTTPPNPGTIVTSLPSVCSGQSVTFDLTGNSIGSGLSYVWESSPSGIAGTFTPLGASSVSTAYTSVITTSAYYRAAVTCSGNTQYTPEIYLQVNPPFAGGSYTIDASMPTDIISGGINFQTFTEAMAAIACGVSAPIVFDVVPGTPYNERIIFPSTIVGTSATNTITINGNGAVLNFNSTDMNSRAGIQLNGTDYVTINNLVINATGTATTEYGWGIQITGDADHNTIQGCTVNLTTASTSTNYAGIIVNGSATGATTGGGGDYNVITGNTINGGYYGIVVAGIAATHTTNNTISNNIVNDPYAYTIYTSYCDNALIENNDVSRATRTGFTTFYGIYMGTGNTSCIVNANRIHTPFGGNTATTSTVYGIYISSDATASNANLLSNNLIYDFKSNGTQYGIYNVTAEYSRFYHNVVVLDHTASTVTSTYSTRAFYLSGAAAGVESKNNIFYVTRGVTTGERFIMHVPSATAVSSENNDFFINAGTGTYVGFDGANRIALGDWQTSTGQDLNTKTADPLFINPAAGDFTPSVADLDNAGFPVGVATDFIGNTRNAATPDIGAYEFNVAPCTGAVAGTAGAPAGICTGQNVNLTLTGYTANTGITIQWMSTATGLGNWQPISGATTASYTVTGQASSTDYRAEVTCSAGGVDNSNAVTVIMNPFYECYCTPVITSTGAAITKVVIPGTTLNNLTGVAAAPYYVTYPASGNTTATLVQGTSYTLNLTTAASSIGSMWIDYDQNGVFNSNEWVQTATTGTTHSVTFTVPMAAIPGLTGMRIRTRTTGANAAGDPCTSMTTAETENYLITIAQLVACNGAPAAGTATGPSNPICAGNTAALNLTGYSVATGITIGWEQYDNASSSWMPIPGSTTSINSPVLNVTSNFRAVVTCTNTSSVSYSNTVTVTVNNPQIANTYPGGRCGTGQVTLLATASPATATLNWYAAATGGNPLSQGGVFVTPSISANTTYYVSAAEGGTTTSVSPINATIGAGGFTNLETYRTFFTALSSFKINSVDIFPQTVGQSSTINIYTAANVLVASVPYTTTTAGSTSVPQTVTMNVQLNPGDYYIKMGNNSASLYRNTAGSAFPYTIPGVVTLTGQSFSGYPQYFYYFYNWQVTSGCESARVPVTATINPAATGNGLAHGGTVAGSMQADGATVAYDDACTDKVVSITDAPGGNVLGITSAIVVTAPTVQTFNSAPFVPRVYDITPASNGAATLTIYALQSEFDAYNTYVTSNSLVYPLLPANPTDPAVSNIVITQYHGGALSGTTGPLNLYDATQDELIPASSITASWTGQYWALTFPVSGFSGFFIHTGSGVLDITLRNITATNAGSRNRVDWSTAHEESGDRFAVERSTNGKTYEQVSMVSAHGEASTYSFWDESPMEGMNYYRLRMISASGEARYSKVVSAFVKSATAFYVEAFPNPATSVVTVKVLGAAGSNAMVSVTDITGKVLKTVMMNGETVSMTLSDMTPGMYLIKYKDDKHQQVIKINKQ